MDRPLIQVGELPCAEDVMGGWKDALYGLGLMASAAIGNSTGVAGFGISPTGPASLSFNIGQGSIYSPQTVDGTSYGVLGTDSNTIVKQGILAAPVTLTVTPPSTSGFSQVYLVQVAYSDVDTGAALVPFFNSLDPTHPSSSTQNTIRQGQAVVQLKAGTAASTGSQTIPTPDVGFVGLWAVTVANGATTVTSANWTQLSVDQYSAPWFPNLESLDTRYLRQPPTSTFFVNGAIGSDTLYDGTSATISGPHGPFATLPGAVGNIQNYASAGTATVNIAAGSYAGVNINSAFVNSWRFIGSGTGSCTVTGTSSTVGAAFGVSTGCSVVIDQMSVASLSSRPSIASGSGASVSIGTVNFSAPPSSGSALASFGGIISTAGATNTWRFATGTYASFILIELGGQLIIGNNTGFSTSSLTINYGTSNVTTGTIQVAACGSVQISPAQFTQAGTVTGPRFNCGTAGGINSQGGGTGLLFGTTAGVVNAPGWYA